MHQQKEKLRGKKKQEHEYNYAEGQEEKSRMKGRDKGGKGRNQVSKAVTKSTETHLTNVKYLTYMRKRRFILFRGLYTRNE